MMANQGLNNFKFCHVLLSYLALLSFISSSEVPRPRGVSLSRAPLYNTDKDFTCFDGTLTIPFTQVNDDYCDCPDASDEPGTAACPNGLFHCTNAGHKPVNIASSRVNDGICDCCDGSDEYANERSRCVNNCNELGRSAREEAQRKAELLKAGKQIRAELSQRGVQIKQEKKEQLTEFEKNKHEAENIKAEKEMLKKQIEDLENAALAKYREIEEEERKQKQAEEAARNREEALEKFALLDSNADGKLDLSEIKARNSFDQDRNGEITDDEAKHFLNDKEEVDVEEFVANCWLRVKPYLLIDSGFYKPPTGEQEQLEEPSDDDQHPEGDDIDDQEQFDTEQEEAEEEEEEQEHDEEEEEQRETVEETTPPPPSKYDEETQKLIDQANHARQEFNDAEKEVKHIETQIKEIQEYLEKDFGPEEEFAPLEGLCFDYSDYEYVYSLCPFDKAVQKPKSSSSETRLGVWSKWVGPEENRYDVMLYDRGQSCWNGPQRSTHVRVTCGSEDKLTGVSEPNRCEYLFEFSTPAACKEAGSDVSEDVHDEL